MTEGLRAPPSVRKERMRAAGSTQRERLRTLSNDTPDEVLIDPPSGAFLRKHPIDPLCTLVGSQGIADYAVCDCAYVDIDLGLRP